MKADDFLKIGILLIFFIPSNVFSWDNPCYKKAVPFQTIPHDKESIIAFESRRVISIDDDTFTYTLGKEVITIKAEDFASQRFLKDVKAGRCSARETVTLTPERKSPFNRNFKAVRPRKKSI